MVRYGRGQYRGMGVVNIEVWAWSMVKYGGVVNCTITSSSKETSDMFTAQPLRLDDDSIYCQAI